MKCTPASTMTLGVDPGRLARERQAVADDVRDAMEDFRRHVVVREDHRVASLLQRAESPRCPAAKTGHSIGGMTRETRS